MTFAEYINWVIDNPKNFEFDMAYSDLGHIYYIYYKSPITNNSSFLIKFQIKGDNIIENNTGLRIAKINEVNIEKLNKLIKNEQYF